MYEILAKQKKNDRRKKALLQHFSDLILVYRVLFILNLSYYKQLI